MTIAGSINLENRNLEQEFVDAANREGFDPGNISTDQAYGMIVDLFGIQDGTQGSNMAYDIVHQVLNADGEINAGEMANVIQSSLGVVFDSNADGFYENAPDGGEGVAVGFEDARAREGGADGAPAYDQDDWVGIEDVFGKHVLQLEDGFHQGDPNDRGDLDDPNSNQ